MAGYPLVSVYLTGEELKTAAEIDVSVTDHDDCTAVSERDTMDVQFNRLILNRVTDVRLNAEM